VTNWQDFKNRITGELEDVPLRKSPADRVPELTKAIARRRRWKWVLATASTLFVVVLGTMILPSVTSNEGTQIAHEPDPAVITDTPSPSPSDEPSTPSPEPTPTTDSLPPGESPTVTIYLLRASGDAYIRDSYVSVQRTLNGNEKVASKPSDRDLLEASLTELLKGVTPEESSDGFVSAFNSKTAGSLLSVEVDSDGGAVVDFKDFTESLPEASTTQGSAILLTQLNSTVFTIDSVRSVQYQVEGSCDAFWSFFQQVCSPVAQDAWERK
jgi:spore germination protein GerM